MTDAPYYATVPHAPQQWERIWAERLVYAVNLLIGKANCTGDLTLTPSVVATVLTDPRIHPAAVIVFMPTTANAAIAAPAIWVDTIGNGAATIHHASAAAVDQTFRYGILG